MKNTLKALFIGLGFVGLTAFVVRSQDKKVFDSAKFKQEMQDALKSGKFEFLLKAGAMMVPYETTFRAKNYEALEQFKKTYNPQVDSQTLEGMINAFWKESGPEMEKKLTQMYKKIVGEDLPQKEIDSFEQNFKSRMMQAMEKEFQASTKIYQEYLRLRNK